MSRFPWSWLTSPRVHDVATVHDQGWLRLRNGVLLRAAVSAAFAVIVAAHSNLRYQQNLPKIGIGAVVVMRVRNRFEDLRPLIPDTLDALALIRGGEVIEIHGQYVR